MSQNIPRFCIIHCSDVSYKTNPMQYTAINRYHRDVRGFPESSIGSFVGYHRLIDNGINIQCRLDTDVGAHCNQQENGLSLNFQSLGICVSGDFDIEPMKPSDYFLLQEQVWKWQDQYNIPDGNVRFHRYYAKDKTCPGLLLNAEWLAKLLKRSKAVPTASCVSENDTIVRQRNIITMLLDAVDRLFHRK